MNRILQVTLKPFSSELYTGQALGLGMEFDELEKGPGFVVKVVERLKQEIARHSPAPRMLVLMTFGKIDAPAFARLWRDAEENDEALKSHMSSMIEARVICAVRGKPTDPVPVLTTMRSLIDKPQTKS